MSAAAVHLVQGFVKFCPDLRTHVSCLVGVNSKSDMAFYGLSKTPLPSVVEEGGCADMLVRLPANNVYGFEDGECMIWASPLFPFD